MATTTTTAKISTAGIQAVLDMIQGYGVVTTLPAAADVTSLELDGKDLTIVHVGGQQLVSLNPDMKTDFVSLRVNFVTTSAENITDFDQQVNDLAAVQIAALIDGAPETLDTLNELAAALDDDNDFAGTMATALAGKSNIGHQHIASDITDFDTEVSNNTDVAANTAKVSFPGFGTTAGTALEGDTVLFDGQYSSLTGTPTEFTPEAHTHTLSDITDSGTAAGLDVANTGNASTNQVVKGDDTRLTDARTPVTHTHTLAQISDFDANDYATGAEGDLATTALQPGDIGSSVQGYNANTVIDSLYVRTDENFTTADHAKLDGIAAGAEVNVNADWNATTGDAQILNKPTLGTAAATDSTDYAPAVHTHVKADITDFSDADYAAASHTHAISDVTNLQTELDSKIDESREGQANGIATLDASGLVPSSQLPSYVDDVLEYANEASFPATGETGKIYIDTSDGSVHRWSGTAYIDISDYSTPGHTHTLSEITDFDANDYATGAEGDLATTSLQPGDIGVSVQAYDANIVSDALYVRTDENFTTADHTKLDGIQAGAEVNVNADWNAVSGDAEILNKPTLGTAAATDSTAYATAAQGTTADSALQPSDIGTTVQGYDANIVSDALYVRTDQNFTNADHTKLDGIAAGAEVNVNADWTAVGGDAEILNKPTLGTAAATDASDYATAAQGATADSALQNINSESIDELSDVDTTTSAPATDDLLSWNGSAWVPRKEVNTFGYEFTGGFAGKPASNNYAWEAGTGISLTADTWTHMEFDSTVQQDVDTPYWSDPAPLGNNAHHDVGIFEGIHMPDGVTSLYDFDYTWTDGGVGRIDVSDAAPGDLIRVRMDYNVIPSVANSVIEAALDWNTRDSSDNITFQFYLTANPSTFGSTSAGQTYLLRTEMTGYFASNEDVNALVRPMIKCNNICTVQPLTILTILQKQL